MKTVRGVLALCLGSLACGLVEAQTSFEPGDGWRGETESGNFDWQLSGRLHLDSASFSDDVTPLEDETEMRRARLIFRAGLRDAWRFTADYEFSTNAPGWRGLNAQYRGWDEWRVTIGNQIVPFSMEEITSSSEIAFIERALPNALSPGFLTGVSFQTVGRQWTFTGGAFADELSDQERRKADGQSVAFRFTATPVRHDESVLHFGIATELRDIGDGSVRLRSRPESYLTDQRLVDTGTLTGIGALDTLGLEIGGKHGPFSVRTEYIRSRAAGTGIEDLAFNGAYVAISYVVTGESVDYNRRSGTFGGVEPRRRSGAVEIVARMSSLDLSDGSARGGVERNRSLGVNWYLRERLRLMVDFVAIDAEPNRNGVNESPNMVLLRFQAEL